MPEGCKLERARHACEDSRRARGSAEHVLWFKELIRGRQKDPENAKRQVIHTILLRVLSHAFHEEKQSKESLKNSVRTPKDCRAIDLIEELLFQNDAITSLRDRQKLLVMSRAISQLMEKLFDQ